LINILKIRYDDIGYWYSSKIKMKTILSDPYTPEMFIIYSEEKNINFCLLTDLQGKDVIIKDEVIIIPDPNEFFKF